jgi:hypothetical protein
MGKGRPVSIFLTPTSCWGTVYNSNPMKKAEKVRKSVNFCQFHWYFMNLNHVLKKAPGTYFQFDVFNLSLICLVWVWQASPLGVHVRARVKYHSTKAYTKPNHQEVVALKNHNIAVPVTYKTSTTLYITCIAGSQYNFIHITWILFNFSNDITGCQYNFIHITRILFNSANDIGVPNRGPQIEVPNGGVPNGGVPNRGPKWGCPKSRSKSGFKMGVPNQGPK